MCVSIMEQYSNELKEKRKSVGDNHPSVAKLLNMIALKYFYFLNNTQEALRYHFQALNILRINSVNEARTSPIHSDIAITLIDVGNVYRRQADYTRANISYQEALDIFRSSEQQGNLRGNYHNVFAALRGIGQTSRSSITGSNSSSAKENQSRSRSFSL
mmetsp:Transcript_28357/g.32614  ORF Transcript_28357/g.32614 Transcript_28357/m.32614 type:complete len:159 (-) Transcript_28357:252-728(-)